MNYTDIMNIFYTYAYLREDGTPYYIGKGKGDRAWNRHSRKTPPPTDHSRILILKKNLSEEEAFRHEVYMVSVFGRKDMGTGILLNFTDGGEGISGFTHSPETCQKMSDSQKGRVFSDSHRKKLRVSAQKRTHCYEHTEETKKKISESKRGRPLSDEHRRKLSEARRRTVEMKKGAKK